MFQSYTHWAQNIWPKQKKISFKKNFWKQSLTLTLQKFTIHNKCIIFKY